MLAGSWSISDISAFYNQHHWYWLFNILGFGVSMIALLGKLEKVPFDIPEAETEIVGGTFTEYSGKLLAMFRLAIDIEVVVCAALDGSSIPAFRHGSSSGIGLCAVYS